MIASAAIPCERAPLGIAVMQHDGELPATMSDARASLELLTAIYYSAQTGHVGELPIGEDHPKYSSWRPG